MKEQVTNFTTSLWAGLTVAFTGFMHFIPSLLGAVLILVAGWYISKFIGKIVESVLITMKVEGVVENANISGYLPHTGAGGKLKISTFASTMVKWFIFLIFVQAAVVTLGIEELTGLIHSIILFIPRIVVAAAILIAGAWAARFFSGVVERATPQVTLGSSNTLALLTRYGILGFAVIAAISQLGIATNLINILFTGLVGSLALAFGLAFGLGGRGAASDITRSLLDKSRSFNSGITPQRKIDEQLNH